MAELNGRRTNAEEKKTRTSARHAVATLSARTGNDPMARVFATGGRVPVSFTVAAAVFLHVGMAAGATAAAHFGELFAWERAIREVIDYRLSLYEMDIIKEPAPPPPPPPVEEPPPTPEPVKHVAKDDPPPPPPQPAEAGKVLTADPDPNEPVDLTGGFVQGNGQYTGGTTSATGTGKHAVYNPAAAPTGVPGGTGTRAAPVVRKDDKTRVPGLLGSVDWNDCPFPGEADAEQVDQAFVLIQVKVKPDGSPENVSVLQDPGHGFGREARKCAMRKNYSQGLDADGNSVAGTTKPFRVRFER